MQIAILAHEKFPERAKTAVGVLRYSDYDVSAVLDRKRAGGQVADYLPGVPDAPIVESMADVESVDALLIGIAPIGGGFDESWRADVENALSRGCDVISGLHYFLSEGPEFVSLAEENDCELWDVRKPEEDLTVSQGIANEVDAEVILTVGTDCSVGKMTVSLELARAAQAQGIDAAFIPTGQTGIMIEGWGHPIDRVVSDFTAGAVEEMILEKGDEHDYLFVEGQGTIIHPAYSAVTCGILHGSMPDSLVLCHVAGREEIHGYEEFSIPPMETYVDLYEGLAAPVHECEVAGGALNTMEIAEEGPARDAISEYVSDLGVPASDPVRFETDEILDGVL